MSRDHSECRRGFTRRSQAWYAKSLPFPDDVTEEVMFGIYHREGGTTGEMAMRWHCLDADVCPRIECFGDSFDALRSFGDLLAKLAEYDIDHRPMIDRGAKPRLTPEEFCKLLIGCGFEDRTERTTPNADAEFQRALAVVGAICNAGYAAMGYPQKDAGVDLKTLSLQEMLDAVKVVKGHGSTDNGDGTMTIHVVPDDRMTAAVYALVNYEPKEDVIAVIGHRAIVVGRLGKEC